MADDLRHGTLESAQPPGPGALASTIPLAIESYLDSWNGRIARGWAWCPDQAEAALQVELVAPDGVVVAGATADDYRGDLADAQKRGGRCLFAVTMPGGYDGGALLLRARLDDRTAEIAPGLAPAPPPAKAGPSYDGSLGDDQGARGHVDSIGPDAIAGWVHGRDDFGPALPLELWENDWLIASGTANGWRNDIEDFRQGNGRVGFRIAYPPGLFDGAPHRIVIKRADTGRQLVRSPIEVRLADRPPQAVQSPAPARPADGTPIELSIIVNFYNMHREAARTLESLSRRFQRDIGDLAYEVICIDNGSTPPMESDWVAAFGPEFRLFHPERRHPSPVFALNEAAAVAKGRWVALMIDGAHLLSPGVIAEAVTELRQAPNAVVGVRHWFIGGDQRWLSQIAYQRELEDIVFAKIDWPNCGYRIFEIGVPMFESPNHWVDGMSESNCLFLSAEAWRAIGGYDEAFDTPGAGLANLDLFGRAARAPGAYPISLVGEATFHQYHEGTTTNVSNAEKDARVRSYSAEYERLRGRPYEPVLAKDMKVRGQIRVPAAFTSRQRPPNRVFLGLTDELRPGELHFQFDEGSQQYLRGAYVEARLHDRTRWAGEPTGVSPADLIEIQQMLHQARPEVLILKDVAPGIASFVRSILPAIRLEGVRIVCVARSSAGAPRDMPAIVGDSMDRGILDRIEAEIGAAEHVCVLFQPAGDERLPLEPLRRYAQFVSVDGYIVVLGGATGQPSIGYSRQWTMRAIQRFIGSGVPYRVDTTFNAHLISTCPSGFLQRLADTRLVQDYDETLDVLEDY